MAARGRRETGKTGDLMEENHIPVAPAILGIVLGPIAGVLGVTTILVWMIPLVMMIRRRRIAGSVS